MATLETIFAKPVNRPIEGVIKADDEASLRLEMEEYVLTNEVAKRLESFLEAYNDYAGANGVWVSGFFGSGKSHLLKMLAFLLENRHIEGAPALDLFLPKCGDNELLRGDLRKAAAIPSKSILFNIDQKASIISKAEIDALLAVFVKVFDEMCGYYGKQGHIAQFERDLDSRGLYGPFRAAYEAEAGRSWERGREQALLEAKNIAAAYAAVTGNDAAAAQGILDKYRNEYRVSIEDFAEQVQAYIEQESAKEGQKAFRLNFFVDEVGQYIADNVKLMTNLQTIAESLATRCQGRAWIIVTAQEDMGSVVGEMDKQQGNDFSKIQARFDNRMKLTSADVAEVIQKRLLTKTEEGARMLAEIHAAQSNNFKTLFDFADGSQTYRRFRDQDDFAQSYPFIPYQFSLFQAAIQNLSQHSAFEGRHSSVGERSMLGVFQQVAMRIAGYETGRLATFDLMFEGIRSALKSNIQRAIIQAETHLPNSLAVRLLKALFLVKYVKEFKATPRNLRILLQDDFDQELPALRKQIEEALGLLEQKTYVQRNGELYEYLTDEEKDIEEAIKHTDVETSEVAAELERIVFERVIKDRKIRYDENNTDYPFSRKLDGRLHGREYELAIHVVSPFHEHAGQEDIVRMEGMGKDELRVLLPSDDRLMRDLLTYKKTEKYIKQNTSIAQQQTVKRILRDKGSQNQERLAELEQRAGDLVAEAKLFVDGARIENGSGDAQTRVAHGFQQLIARTYPNLRMLRGVTYAEQDIARYLSQDGPYDDGLAGVTEPERDILGFIQGNKRNGVRSSLKSVVERFERKPYGWSYPAVLCTLAKLCARGKIEMRSDSNLLEDHELEPALRNSKAHGNVLLDPQSEFTASQVRALKEFFEDFFDAPPQNSEAKALAKETGDALGKRMQNISQLADQVSRYPFLNVLQGALEKLQEATGKPYAWYLTDLPAEKADLLCIKEGAIDPVQQFMNGSQKAIFDTARDFVQNQEDNFAYIEGDEADQVVASLNDSECFRGNRMQQVKTQVEALQSRIDAARQAEITKSVETLNSLKNRLCGMPEFEALDSVRQEQLTRPFEEIIAKIRQHSLIAVVRDALRRFEDNEYPRLLSKMTAWAQAATKPETGDAPPDGPGAEPATHEYVSSRAVPVPFEKAWLADEDDVDHYLKSMRNALLEEIRKGKRIQL